MVNLAAWTLLYRYRLLRRISIVAKMVPAIPGGVVIGDTKPSIIAEL